MIYIRRLYLTRTLIAVLLALCLLTPTAFASQLDAKRKELQDVNAKIQATKNAIASNQNQQANLLRQIDQSDRQITNLQTQVANQQAELDKTTAKRQAIEQKLNETQKKLDAAQAELSAAEAKLSQKRDAFNKRIDGIYKSGNSGILTMILSSQNLADLIERTSLINIIAQNDAKLVKQMRDLRESVAQKVDQIAMEKQTIDKQRLELVDEENHEKAIKNRLLAKQAELQNARNNQKAMLASLEKQKVQLDDSIDVLESTSNMIAQQIRSLQRGGSGVRVSRGSVGSGSGGNFIYPVNAPITSGFGWRYHPILHYTRLHAGIDFGCAYGTPVHAAAGGTVIIAGSMSGYGNAVVVDHGNGLSSLYGHLSSVHVSVGEHVSQGQVIGNSGNSGLSTGPHLHFEIRVNGNPQNPMNWL